MNFLITWTFRISVNISKSIPSVLFVQYGIQDGGYSMTWFNIGPYGKNVLKDIWDN
jgi:hypothetical protein